MGGARSSSSRHKQIAHMMAPPRTVGFLAAVLASRSSNAAVFSTCYVGMEKFCTPERASGNTGDCYLCLGQHQHDLQAEGCTTADFTNFCTGGPIPPSPPGPTPPGPPHPPGPPPPPAPGPGPPANQTGCQLRPGQPAVYTPLCMAAQQQQCESPLYEHACYWASPPGPTAPSCMGWMTKSGCGSAPSEEACQQCMVGKGLFESGVLAPSCTGTCYACAVSDFTAFCARAPHSPEGNETGCQLRPGQPQPFAAICASRTSEAACMMNLFQHTCYWASPPLGPSASCEGLLQKQCSGHKAQGVGACARPVSFVFPCSYLYTSHQMLRVPARLFSPMTFAGSYVITIATHADSCEKCCVDLAVASGNVLHPSCTGTCYDCSISAFTDFCTSTSGQ